MNTESARKAAEQLWIEYASTGWSGDAACIGQEDFEKALETYAAACQTVAPPPENLKAFEKEMTALWWTAEMKPDDVMRLIREHFGVPSVRSSTYGDLPQSIREAEIIEPHEWDNMDTSAQRDWALQRLGAAPAVSTLRCPTRQEIDEWIWANRFKLSFDTAQYGEQVADLFELFTRQFFHPAPSPPPIKSDTAESALHEEYCMAYLNPGHFCGNVKPCPIHIAAPSPPGESK